MSGLVRGGAALEVGGLCGRHLGGPPTTVRKTEGDGRRTRGRGRPIVMFALVDRTKRADEGTPTASGRARPEGVRRWGARTARARAIFDAPGRGKPLFARGGPSACGRLLHVPAFRSRVPGRGAGATRMSRAHDSASSALRWRARRSPRSRAKRSMAR